MLTGTPLDLTPFGSLLSGLVAALGWLYWALAAGLIVLALWLPKARWLKLGAAAVVAGAVVYPLFIRPVQQQADALQQAEAEYTQRHRAAVAHFEMRCKSAGEFIQRTADNVDGVVWMKWRDKSEANDDYNQFKLSDPFGRDCTAEGCIDQLLRLAPQGGRFTREVEQRKGRYAWVETVDPADGRMYRYIGVMKPRPSWTPEAIEKHRRDTGQPIDDSSLWFQTERQPVDRFTARYGVTWDDISTREDREHWIAGGSLKVVDLQTSEVIAERIGYMMDWGLGDRAGFRTPWLFALRNACPSFPSDATHSTRRWPQTDTVVFATKVLTPTGAN